MTDTFMLLLTIRNNLCTFVVLTNDRQLMLLLTNDRQLMLLLTNDNLWKIQAMLANSLG